MKLLGLGDRHHDAEPTSWSPYPPQSAASQYCVRKENDVFYGTPKGNKYEMGGKYIFQYFL